MRYKCNKQKIIARNSKFHIRFDELVMSNGSVLTDYLIVDPIVKLNDDVVGVCVIPILDGKIGLMQGWRHQLDKEILQAPSGFVEQKEELESAAVRELCEETGLICEKNNLVSLGKYYPDAGLINGSVAIFLAKNCKFNNQKISNHEVGCGELIFFDNAQIMEISLHSRSIGGSTLVGCLKILNGGYCE